MKSKRDSFIFYRSFYKAIKCLSKEDQLFFYRAICRYSLDQKLPKNGSLTGTRLALWSLISPQLLANYSKFTNGRLGAKYGKLGAEYGKKGGRPKTNENPPKTPLKPPTNPPNVNENVNENVLNVQRDHLTFNPNIF